MTGSKSDDTSLSTHEPINFGNLRRVSTERHDRQTRKKSAQTPSNERAPGIYRVCAGGKLAVAATGRGCGGSGGGGQRSNDGVAALCGHPRTNHVRHLVDAVVAD